MAHFGGGHTQGPGTGLCDYCHQKPKFPPYNYCGKACGSRAKATGGTSSSSPALCKQCVQRPVHRGHQFCGRNCANTWQAMYGKINTSGSSQHHHSQQSWNTMPPPQTQNYSSSSTQPFQGPSQGGNGGGIKGIVSTLKGLASQGHQPQPPQQQYGGANPSMISPPITPMSSGMGSPMSPGMGNHMPPPGMGGPISSGMSTGSNQHFYDPSPPTSPGFQDPNAIGQTTGQHFPTPTHTSQHAPNQNTTPGQISNTMSMAMDPTNGGNPPSYDPYDPNYDPMNQDPVANSNHHLDPSQFPGQNQNNGGPPPVQTQVQAQFSLQPSTSTSSGAFPTCRLNGCNKPVYVDPVTQHESEYCTRKHREEAKIYGQVNPCIMCLKMPRGPNDHFCSKGCRDKALSR